MKTCSKCNTEKEDSLFIPKKNICKSCMNDYLREYKKTEKYKLQVKVYEQTERWKQLKKEKNKKYLLNLSEEKKQQNKLYKKEWDINHRKTKIKKIKQKSNKQIVQEMLEREKQMLSLPE